MIDESLLVETIESIGRKVEEIDTDLCYLGLAFGALIEALSEKGIVDKDALLNKQAEMCKKITADGPTLTRVK